MPIRGWTAPLLVVVGLSGVWGRSAGAQSGGSEQFALLRQIDSLVTVRKYAAATPLVRRAFERDTTNGTLANQMGTLLERIGATTEALPWYRRAWVLGFNSGPYTAYSIAQGYARLHDRGSTLAWLDTALIHRMDGRTSIGDDTLFLFLQHDTSFQHLAGMLPERALGRVAAWRFDIRLFNEEAKRLHASLAREAFGPAFDDAVRALVSDVPRLPDDSIIGRLTRLVTMLHDGHSNVLPPGPQRVLQMDLYEFSDGLFLIDGDAHLKPWVGSRVVKIGDRDVDQLRTLLAPYEHRDNERMLMWTFPTYVGLVAYLRYAGVPVSDSGAWLTLQDAAGAQHRLFVAADTLWHERKLFPPVTAQSEPALYLRHVAQNYWLDNLPAEHAVYAQVNQLWSLPRFPIQAFADSLARTLRATRASTLIIDLRLNNGGNAFLTPPLLHAAVGFEVADSSHRVFVISGRGTFSAAQILLTRLEQQTHAIFVGEPSSSRPNFVGEDGERIRLPYSKVMVNISFKRHQESAYDDDRPWIPVSVPTPLSSADYFANRDPALEAVLEIVRRITQ